MEDECAYERSIVWRVGSAVINVVCTSNLPSINIMHCYDSFPLCAFLCALTTMLTRKRSVYESRPCGDPGTAGPGSETSESHPANPKGLVVVIGGPIWIRRQGNGRREPSEVRRTHAFPPYPMMSISSSIVVFLKQGKRQYHYKQSLES